MSVLTETPAPPTDTEDIEVTVVMPCLNEARTVGRCVAKARDCLARLGVRGEIVVADNGSTDGSQALASEQGARVVTVPRRGYGAALQGGIAAARGRYVIMGDADDSYDFTRLDAFIERLRAGDELVMGNRFRGGIRPGAMPWLHRYVGNPVLTGILNLFFRSPIRDAHCGLRGFRRDSILKLGLTTPGMEFASEMVVKSVLRGLTISEVPTTLDPDGRDRPPHLRSFRDGWRHLRFLLLLCPLWLFLIPAGVLIVLGLALMIWLTPGPRPIAGGVVLDVHTMLLGAMAALLGYQVVWLGLFAKVFGRRSGLLPPDPWAVAVERGLSLERGLVAGLMVTLVGLGLEVWLVLFWVGHDLGPLNVEVTLRYALWGLLLLIGGVQTLFSSFFLSLLRMTGDA